MTPRCLWDAEGYLWEVSPCGDGVKVIWDPYKEEWYPSYAVGGWRPRAIVDHYGTPVAVA